jgi:hypothetical protein
VEEYVREPVEKRVRKDQTRFRSRYAWSPRRRASSEQRLSKDLKKSADFDRSANDLTLERSSTNSLNISDGIPIRYLSPEIWTLRFFGSYAGPIELFKKFYQQDLGRYYAERLPKPLTFGFGYQWNPHDATLILAVRK